MSPDRLAELRRQRALVAQHLAWIDAELTAAGAGQPPANPAPAVNPRSDEELLQNLNSPATTPNGDSASPAEELDPSVALANARADEIIERYRATEALDPNAAKRGCLVLAGAAAVLGGAALLAIYYFGYAR